MSKDHGLFNGARPELCYKVGIQLLSNLLSDKLKGSVVLTHDESASHWRRVLDYQLVYGIRESKGLEFKSVIILNFFAEIPSTDQKPWRDLLLDRIDHNFEQDHPSVENQLKLLYVAVTRCIERLFFVETSISIAGDAAIRWLCTKENALATRNNVMDVAAMSMTSDEFVIQGVDNAQQAESSELEFAEAITLLDRAIYCFEAANSELASKARIHRISIQFRSDLTRVEDSSSSSTPSVVFETKAAQIVESLLREKLFVECIYLIESVAPFLSVFARDELEKRVISKIQTN